MNDEWHPEPEERIDADWLRREHERLDAQARTSSTPDDEPLINGAARGVDGRFAVSVDRVHRTDGRTVLPCDEYQEVLMRIAAEIRRAPKMSPKQALDGAREIRRLCDGLEREAVAFARGRGWAWRDIGDALGISESGAHRRFAR